MGVTLDLLDDADVVDLVVRVQIEVVDLVGLVVELVLEILHTGRLLEQGGDPIEVEVFNRPPWRVESPLLQPEMPASPQQEQMIRTLPVSLSTSLLTRLFIHVPSRAFRIPA